MKTSNTAHSPLRRLVPGYASVRFFYCKMLHNVAKFPLLLSPTLDPLRYPPSRRPPPPPSLLPSLLPHPFPLHQHTTRLSSHILTLHNYRNAEYVLPELLSLSSRNVFFFFHFIAFFIYDIHAVASTWIKYTNKNSHLQLQQFYNSSTCTLQ